MLSSHPHPRSVRIAFASAALTNSIRGRAFIGPPCLPSRYGIDCDRERRLARHLGQIEHPAAGHSDPNDPERFIFGFHGRLFEIFLAKGPHQESGDSRVHELNFLDRDAYLGGLACSRELARR